MSITFYYQYNKQGKTHVTVDQYKKVNNLMGEIATKEGFSMTKQFKLFHVINKNSHELHSDTVLKDLAYDYINRGDYIDVKDIEEEEKAIPKKVKKTRAEVHEEMLNYHRTSRTSSSSSSSKSKRSCGGSSSSKKRIALKAESNFVAGGSVLKLEVQVLRRLVGRKYVARLLASGKKEKYCYMVISLFGPSLSRLFRHCNKEFTISTQIRLGLQILYGLKQLHEVGYVHRDLKPANVAVGMKGYAARVVHLLDFGLSREFIIKNENGKAEIRKPRENTLFRGTTKYCSMNSHTRAEQGRPDDLWSMVYVLVEMRGPLPWDTMRDKHQIGHIKRLTSDEKLLEKCVPQMHEITLHLRELDYYKRPDYLRLYTIFEEMMVENKIKFSDPLDWEVHRKPAGYGNVSGKLSQSKTGKQRQAKNMTTVSEDVSMNKTSEKTYDQSGDVTQEENEDKPPFSSAEFETNELGF